MSAVIVADEMFKDQQPSKERGIIMNIDEIVREEWRAIREAREKEIEERQAAMRVYVKDLILENGKYGRDGLSLFTSDLSFQDKQNFLSYLVDKEDYQFFIRSTESLREAIKEYDYDMQYWINQQLDDIWHNFMEEAGMVARQYPDNGEIYFVRGK